MPSSMCVRLDVAVDSESRMAAQLAPLLTTELMPYFLKKPFSCAITIDEQSVSAIMPNFTSAVFGRVARATRGRCRQAGPRPARPRSSPGSRRRAAVARPSWRFMSDLGRLGRRRGRCREAGSTGPRRAARVWGSRGRRRPRLRGRARPRHRWVRRRPLTTRRSRASARAGATAAASVTAKRCRTWTWVVKPPRRARRQDAARELPQRARSSVRAAATRRACSSSRSRAPLRAAPRASGSLRSP